MAQISEWLRDHKLDQLLTVFEANDIDMEILFDLTDDELKELGLTLGLRKRLRSAIDSGRGAGSETVPSSSDSANPPTTVTATTAETVAAAERRQLTTMFVDLVGSTSISERLDPEDMRDIILSYQNSVAGLVTRHRGHVAKYMGDGVLCYFGWPMAHEDDAQRATRTGLKILSALGELKNPTKEKLAARVGIATGLVVVGDLIGEGAAREEAVVGDTPNLAARLQSLAAPDEVLVAETTRQLLKDTFDLTALGSVEVKGLERKIEAWRVVGERSMASRFESDAESNALPMIGREHELGLVLEGWKRAQRGEGQVAILIGEAGIGKSRLTRAVIDAVGRSDHYRISFHCSPYHTDSSFHPIIQQLTHAAQLSDADSPDEKLDKLEANFLVSDPRVLAEILQIDTGRRYEPHNLSPQQMRNRILESTAEEVCALAQQKPVLLVVEDAHWIDASTLEALELCLDQIVDQNVFILITGRPTFEYRFGGHPIVNRFTLNRLGSNQTASVLSAITGGKSLPDELITEIAARTDGVPLFIEELTKTILESGQLRETDTSYQMVGSLSRMTIPATLHDSLMARIDRLQPVKEIAQMAACIGRRFDDAVLSQIAQKDPTTLSDALRQLEEAELIFRTGTPPNVSYVFKHALVRDVAYESLLKKRRKEFHHRIFDVFEADPGISAELTAHHATEAGLTERAVMLWGEAGSAAQARPAYEEAVNHLRMALSVVDDLTTDPKWREREVRLLVQLAQVYVAKEGYASREASEVFAQAMEHIDDIQDAELRVAIFYGIWIAPYIGNRLHHGLELANDLVEMMDKETDPISPLISRRMRAATLISMGRSTEALIDLDISYELYKTAKLEDFSSKFAQDPGVQIWCYQLLAYYASGQQEKALEVCQKAIERAHEINHANTICYAGLHAATLAIWMDDPQKLRSINLEIKKLAAEHSMSLWNLFCDIHDAVADCMEDRPEAAQQLDRDIATYKEGGGGLWETLYLNQMAKMHLRTKNLPAAHATLERAMSEIDTSGEQWVEAELHRCLGDYHCAMGDQNRAKEAYGRAMKIAQQQKAPLLEERARNSMASMA